MKQEQEIEFKALLDKKKWQKAMDKVRLFAEEKETYQQTNYYFDSEDQVLKHQKITCRLRQKETHWEATVKIKHKNESGAANSIERNLDISTEQAERLLHEGMTIQDPILAGLFADLSLEHVDTLHLLGSLTTTRTDFHFYEDIISFDESEYLNQKDYELEWETTNEKSTSFLLTEVLNVPYGNAKGKKNRFMDAIEGLKKARG